MRIAWIALGLLLSMASAHAQKAVASGRPLMLYRAWSTNPDCTSAGTVVMRVAQQAESNLRSVCNRRRVPGVQATYVSQRGYIGPDFTSLEVLYPEGRAVSVRLPIRVM